MEEKKVRVRFAPSPTGHLHIGGLRGALFNWLFARQQKGSFLLRIEDTDRERSREEYTFAILEAFKWCGIESDEPIVYQSHRLELYHSYIKKLVDSGYGYWVEEPDGAGVLGKVLKFRVPRDEVLEFDDVVRGRVSFSSEDIEDFIVVRSDGSPLYNFVVVVDDIEMRISHVIRGEEHLSNTPRQLFLYKAFGVSHPTFAHLPLILGPDGKKLSKRDAATAVIDYKAMGFLPEALCNYLVRLGWAHGDQEIFTQDELVSLFDLKTVHAAGAMFDMQKLAWMNGVYIKKSSSSYLLPLIKELMSPSWCQGWDDEVKTYALDLYKDRAENLLQIGELLQCLYEGPVAYNLVSDEYVRDVEHGNIFLEKVDEKIKKSSSLSSDQVKNICQEIAQEEKISLATILKPLRYALTGSLSSPSVYSIVSLLGKDEVSKRLSFYRGQVQK